MKRNKPARPLTALILASAMLMTVAVDAQEDFAAGAKTFQTRIGRLEFNNGYASPETSRLLYDRYFRLYGPEKEFFDGSWKLDDIERVR